MWFFEKGIIKSKKLILGTLFLPTSIIFSQVDDSHIILPYKSHKAYPNFTLLAIFYTFISLSKLS